MTDDNRPLTGTPVLITFGDPVPAFGRPNNEATLEECSECGHHHWTGRAYLTCPLTDEGCDCPNNPEYDRGRTQGISDHANGVALDGPDQVKVWAEATEEWKRGWSDGYEAAATREGGQT